MIYQFGKHVDQGVEMSQGCENSSQNVEIKFIESIVDLVTDAFSVNHNEQRNFKALLNKVLREPINSHSKPGLLQQYEAYVLEKAAERFHNTLDIPKDLKVNHGHAGHAKYADIVKYIHSHYQKIEANKSNSDAK